MLTQNLPEFWENLYIEHKDYWNLGKATPALLDFFNNPLCPQTGSVLVPGAGFGYDAEAWAKRGHEVLAVDFAPTAVDELDRISRRLENFKSLDLDLFELNPKYFQKALQLHFRRFPKFLTCTKERFRLKEYSYRASNASKHSVQAEKGRQVFHRSKVLRSCRILKSQIVRQKEKFFLSKNGKNFQAALRLHSFL